VLNQPAQLFGGIDYVLLSGTGYLQNPRKHGKFLWSDVKELARLAERLTIDTRLVGLTPGEVATFDSAGCRVTSSEWITPLPDTEPPSDRDAQLDYDLNADLPPLFDRPVEDAERELIRRELDAMAPLLMISPLGEPVGGIRFAVHLRGWESTGGQVFGLDVNRARFVPVDGDMRDALMGVPAGIDCHASDFVAVLDGRIHIWELATSRLRQWYLTPRLDSPVAFLYTLYSEQVRPDLAARLYRTALTEPAR
jgi:hypothetical protein